MATKKVKKDTVLKTVDNFKTTVSNIHDEALNTTDNLVEASLKTGAKWQKLMAKALEGGTDLFAKQQNLVLDTLEEIKGQYLVGSKRFQKLVGLTNAKKKKPGSIEKKVKASAAKTLKTASESMEEAAAAMAEVVKDDFKIIDGVGPKLESMLHDGGYFTYHQLAVADPNDLKILLDAAGPLFKSYNPMTLKQQAKQAAEGKLTK